ncbi:aryl-alcohol dehydrogenase-like predicted oxidoreductase [Paenibacillus forsythiae]|uniref:Aryl-alcohol dehydrogenase-like predicted oxidoreductase n=1 Tax=Paenibacillus forsythiae TaxID=365616 RepID=A0ABU3H9F3_9BACL|nr:aldo/keto reductase [Paenibacillus forsythiae]MDT3427386.1 aryl-alcohol dehydrogenase-like predicted oxidoreductase [Paenibacillus forsythiae]
MRKRVLGSNLEVSEIGLGCMGMSQSYGATDEQEAINTIHYALDNGVYFLDTADMYGNGHNEELIGKALASYKGTEEVIIASKFGIVNGDDITKRYIDGSPEYVRSAIDKSLKRLNLEYLDLYYIHRVDKTVPIEETVGTMSDLVREGKIRHIGICEASLETIERANKVHPITAVQSEYSLWSRDVEAAILPKLQELGIGFVPYSPLGRGFLTTGFQFEEQDMRRFLPRFQDQNLLNNQKLVNQLTKIAEAMNIKTAQLALAWVLHKSENIVPIPGTKKISHLTDNIEATDVLLNTEQISELDRLFDSAAIQGTRYPGILMEEIDA